MSPLNLVDLVQKSHKRLAPLAKEKEVHIEFHSELPKILIHGNGQLLERCLDNILINCLSYTKDLITINITTESKELTVSIHDNGPGFDEDEIHAIFERFYRGPHGHIGLGLAIAKEILTLHHFQIEAKNDHGAIFCIRMGHDWNNLI